MREIEKILEEIDESTRDIISDLEGDIRNDKAFIEISNLAEINEKYGRVYQNFKLIEGEPFGVPFDEKALIAQKLLYISLYLNNW
ncbi:MAG: hypothetical protein LBF22_02365, partial [Deltaproteobacteria bacterium]|nr:hypothetical protein [Deltaproteobacteria bacterium]